MRLFDCMTPDVATVSPEDSAESAWQNMRMHGCHHMVVVEEGVVGVISERDLGGSNGEDVRANKTVADLMSRDVVCAEPDMTIRKAANLMRGRTIGCLPIVDKKDGLAGIVTTSDLLEILGRGGDRKRSSRGAGARTGNARRAR